jgi:hypothetical protein
MKMLAKEKPLSLVFWLPRPFQCPFVALAVHLTGVEPFHRLTLSQVGLIVGKGKFNLTNSISFLYFTRKGILSQKIVF